jgi:pimeloyl-ACP methyl ester carboxylesterase
MEPSATGLQADATEVRTVTSGDGTALVVQRVTRGDHNVLMVPGGPSTGARWAEVARQLEGRVACWLMDRRGRGASGDTPPYSFQREYDDLSAVASAIGGTVVVAAHSSGATCALGAALQGAPFASLVLYEPPWPVDGPLAQPTQIDAVEHLVAAGDRDGALELAFTTIVGIPAPVVEMMQRSPAWSDWRRHAHTWPREMREVEALPRDLAGLTHVDVPVLMLVGGLTSGHLRRAAEAIASALPSATITELAGQGHGALGLAPDQVAAAVLRATGQS